MTKEQKKISAINQKKARVYFGILGKKELILHHTDITMRHNNIERYILWLPEDLIVMSLGEHTRLHQELNGGSFFKGHKHTEEAKEKMSQKALGRESAFKGHQHTEEAKEKNRQAHLGKKFSAETREKWSKQRSGSGNPMFGKHWKVVDGKRVYY